MSIKPTFQGEIQFRRYSDTSTQGSQIVLALADRESLSAFIGKEGKRFMAVLVEIGDDEQPVQPPSKRGPLCIEACDYCKLPEFRQWVAEVGSGPVTEAQARQWILDTCQIASRKELDADSQAAQDFKKWVRIPFMNWQRTQREASNRGQERATR